MRKTLVIFTVILSGLFIGLTLLDYNSDYVAEKTLWSINKKLNKLMRDPEFVPGASFDEIVKEYEDFITRFKDSSLEPFASIHLGKVFMAKKDYLSARRQFAKVIEDHKDEPKIAAEAVLSTAKVFASEGDKVSALATYKRLLDNYPLTEQGMQAPLLIARFHTDHNDLQKARKSFDEAVTYYKALAVTYAGTQTELDAMQLSEACLLAQGRWREAVETLGEELNKHAQQRFVNKVRVSSVIKLINTISITKLNDTGLPISIYEKFIDDHKGHPLNNILKSMVKSLKELRDKGVKES